ncbi:MAG TPA: alpha amylase C-terminal domain-containing protein, partial [Gemmatimonadaceae bacterium]
DVADRENSVVAYSRQSAGSSAAVVILNLTPLPRERYRVGVPARARYERVLSSDDTEWGGSGFGYLESVDSEDSPFHGYPQSIELTLPPLSALVLAPVGP